jgi:PAS domain-containing protein
MNELRGLQQLPLLLLIIIFCSYNGEVAAFTVLFRSKLLSQITTKSKTRHLSSSSPSPPPTSSTDDDDTTTIPAVYPLSRKKMVLIEEAKKLSNTTGSSYSAVGWSNRLGSVLTPASVPGVYTADRPFYWNKIDVGCRMTVIQQPNGDLIIHSPIGIDPPLIRSLEELGGVVKHVISPNYEHVKFASQWARQYPEAKIWGCPGLMEREIDVRWTGEVPFGARPPGFFQHGGNDSQSSGDNHKHEDMWDWEEFQPLHIDTEVNPFTGKSFFNEVIFYHTASKTLLMTDLFWNYPKSDGTTNGQIWDALPSVSDKTRKEDFGPWELAPSVGQIPFGSTAWKFGMDKIFYPFYMNFMIRSDKRQSFNDIARFITCGGDNGGWEVETIIPAHGDIVRGKAVCREVLEKHFNVQCPPLPSPSVDAHFTSPTVLAWVKKKALSYKLERGEDLLEVMSRETGISVNNKGDEDDLMRLATLVASSPLPIASHDFLRADQAIYIYGNQAFLDGFGYEWDEFVELPSSKCVETDAEVAERQKLLDSIKDAAMGKSQSKEVEKYDNLIRVRKDGKKILLKGVNLWNVWDISDNLDDARTKIKSGAMKPIGQAVWIRDVEYLD